MSQPRPSVLWDPVRSPRFLVATATELRLYSSPAVPLGVLTDLASLRALAWSTRNDSLVAIGLGSGRTLLVPADSFGARGNVIQLALRSPRPVNALSFSPDGASLAVGLDKARGGTDSVLLFDVERATSSQPRAGREGGSIGIVEPRPTLQFGTSSESITALAFLSPSLLLAGAGKAIRSYDTRIGSSTIVYASRAVHHLAPNPFSLHQFAARGEDDIIKLYDLRKTDAPLLSFSTARSGGGSKGLAEICWSPDRRGLLGSLERECRTVHLWNLIDGPLALQETTEDRTPLPLDATTSSSASQDTQRLPILVDDRRTQPFELPLCAFTFSRSERNVILGVGREGGYPGGPGYRLERIRIPVPRHSAFLDRGVLLSTSSSSNQFQTFSIPPLALPVDGDEPTTPLVLPPPTGSARGRTSFSAAAQTHPGRRDETIGPSGSLTPMRRLSHTSEDPPLAIEDGPTGLGGMASDIEVIMFRRAREGYGTKAGMNAGLVGEEDESLRVFWNWVARTFLSTSPTFVWSIAD